MNFFDFVKIMEWQQLRIGTMSGMEKLARFNGISHLLAMNLAIWYS